MIRCQELISIAKTLKLDKCSETQDYFQQKKKWKENFIVMENCNIYWWWMKLFDKKNNSVLALNRYRLTEQRGIKISHIPFNRSITPSLIKIAIK